jgi:hypothetical protein
MSDPWETDYRKLWRAAYGAHFALRAFQLLSQGVTPTNEDYDEFAKEAQTVATKAAGRAAV